MRGWFLALDARPVEANAPLDAIRVALAAANDGEDGFQEAAEGIVRAARAGSVPEAAAVLS